MTRRNPYSTGYVAAKIRENTARRVHRARRNENIPNYEGAVRNVEVTVAGRVSSQVRAALEVIGWKVAEALPDQGIGHTDLHSEERYGKTELDSDTEDELKENLQQVFGLYWDVRPYRYERHFGENNLFRLTLLPGEYGDGLSAAGTRVKHILLKQQGQDSYNTKADIEIEVHAVMDDDDDE